MIKIVSQQNIHAFKTHQSLMQGILVEVLNKSNSSLSNGLSGYSLCEIMKKIL